jgi:hypothetical protein
MCSSYRCWFLWPFRKKSSVERWGETVLGHHGKLVSYIVQTVRSCRPTRTPASGGQFLCPAIVVSTLCLRAAVTAMSTSDVRNASSHMECRVVPAKCTRTPFGERMRWNGTHGVLLKHLNAGGWGILQADTLWAASSAM